MTIKTILAHVTGDKAGERTLDAASCLARMFDGHVSGLHVIDTNYISALASPYAQIPQEIIEIRQQADQEAARRAETLFRDRMKREGLSSDWRLARGDPRHEIALQSRYADISVLAQADTEAPSGGIALPADVILLSGLPVLVTPRSGKAAPFGRRILVAWNRSAQSARALHDAMPILERAEGVHVLTVGREDGGHLPGADIAAHLARHGVAAEAEFAQEVSRPAEEVLLAAAKAHGADLIVAGAWGHSRLREMILGGVTKRLLRHAEVPVLFAH